MAYPTGVLSITLENIDVRLLRLKGQLVVFRTACAAGDVLASRIIEMFLVLRVDRNALASQAATPGLGAYAQSQKNAPTLDIVAEFNAVLAATDSVTTWITTNFPKDGGGYILAQSFGADTMGERTFTPAQTAGLRTVLDALIATIA